MNLFRSRSPFRKGGVKRLLNIRGGFEIGEHKNWKAKIKITH